jgi:hypothetical protein
LLVSIAVYAVIGEKATYVTSAAPPPDTLFHTLSLLSISVVAATVVVRRTLVLPAETALKRRGDDSLAIASWRTGYILLYLLSDTLGLFGLALRMAGFTLANIWGFYLGGFLLLLVYSPRTPRA